MPPAHSYVRGETLRGATGRGRERATIAVYHGAVIRAEVTGARHFSKRTKFLQLWTLVHTRLPPPLGNEAHSRAPLVLPTGFQSPFSLGASIPCGPSRLEPPLFQVSIPSIPYVTRQIKEFPADCHA